MKEDEMSELKPCPFCGSLAVVKCRVDSDWGVDLKYRLLNDESNYEIKSMITDENYDPDYQTGDYWGIEIFRCQSCRAEWGGGTDVCVAALNARIAELEAAQRWIPVSERLPNKSGWYLAGLIGWAGGSYTGEVYFDTETGLPWRNSVRDEVYCWLDGVPELPQPPKEREE